MRDNYYIQLFTTLISLLFFATGATKVYPQQPDIQEQVFLQTDRNLYLPGEKIWFRADCFVNNQKISHGLSKVLYVELLNSENEAIARDKYKIDQGYADGMLRLPEGLQTGNYLLRAYTLYMKNFSPEEYYHTVITVINPLIPLKAIDTGGFWKIRSAVIDSSGENILALQFNPWLTGKIRKAELFFPDTNISMKIAMFPNGLASVNLGKLNVDGFRINFYMHSGDTIVKAIQKPASVSFKDVYTGIQLSEPAINIHVSKKNFLPREYVEMVFDTDTPDFFDSFTIAVVKKNTSAASDENLPAFIVDNPFMLDDFLSANASVVSINHQAMILRALSMAALQNRDRKKLTIQNGQDISWYPEIRGVTLQGIVRNLTTKQPLDGMDVMLSVLGENPVLHIYTTNQEGVFIFNLSHTEGLTNVYLSINNPPSEEEAEILINNDFSTEFNPFVLNPPVVDTSMKRFIEEMYTAAQVNQYFPPENMVIHDQGKPIRFSEPDVSVRLDKFVEMKTLESVFNELVPYVKVRKANNIYHLEVLDEKTNQIYDKPLLLVDNLPVTDVNKLLEIHPSRIEQIDVINSTYIYGDHILKGIVMVKTNTDNFGEITLPESFTTLEFLSVAPGYEFRPPDYETQNKTLSHRPDFRTMLYWNPNCKLKKDEELIGFYTSDQLGSYEIVVLGMTKNGNKIMAKSGFAVVSE